MTKLRLSAAAFDFVSVVAPPAVVRANNGVPAALHSAEMVRDVTIKDIQYATTILLEVALAGGNFVLELTFLTMGLKHAPLDLQVMERPPIGRA